MTTVTFTRKPESSYEVRFSRYDQRAIALIKGSVPPSSRAWCPSTKTWLITHGRGRGVACRLNAEGYKVMGF